MRKPKPKLKLNIGGTGRQRKRVATYPIYKEDEENSEIIPEQPELEEIPTTKEVRIEEETSSKTVLTYEVLWDKEMERPQVMRIVISNEKFLNNILKELNKNLARFEWSPLVWCKNPEHTEISAIGKINEKNLMELENFIDKIKSDYSA